MKRRSFLQGMIAVFAAPVVAMKKTLDGDPMPRTLGSTLEHVGVLAIKYRQPLYDESNIRDIGDGSPPFSITLFARNPKLNS